MTRDPDPSDPMWRDTESSVRAARLERLGQELEAPRSLRAEHLDKPGIDPTTGEVVEILKHFRFGQFTQPGSLREVARHYGLLAAATVLMCPAGEQRAVALQKLLEARDAALRAVMP